MEKYRHTIPEIIASVADRYQPSVYDEIKQKYLVLIKVLLENKDKYVRIYETKKEDDNTKKTSESLGKKKNT